MALEGQAAKKFVNYCSLSFFISDHVKMSEKNSASAAFKRKKFGLGFKKNSLYCISEKTLLF